MPAQTITTFLANQSDSFAKTSEPPMIRVNNVTMDFNSATQQLNSLKEYFIAIAKRELMFKRFRALDDISFDVQKGDVFGILGTNGSGKSTLMKIISGVLEPTVGSVEIRGNIAPLIELGAGFDFELTARENIFLNGALLGYSKSFIQQHFDEIVDFAEIRDFLDSPLKNYSSGMVSRIAFAIATVIVPDILIVDEVLSVGDFMFRQKCEKRIQSLIREHGTTVLLVSHSNNQIERLCNKAVWIEKGHIRMIGEAKTVSRTYQALGGRTGSQESETFIFNLLNNNARSTSEKIECILGKDRFEVNSICESLLSKDRDYRTVVVVPGDDPPVVMSGLSIAGALDGICLMTKRAELSTLVSSYISRTRPERVIVLSHANIQENVLSSIKDIAGPSTEMHIVDADDLERLSRLVYELATKLGAQWGHHAILSANRSGAASATVAPIFFLEPTPYIICSFAGPSNDELSEIFRESQTERALVVGNPTPLTDEFLNTLQDGRLQWTRIPEQPGDVASCEALSWLASEGLGQSNGYTTVFVIADDSYVDGFSIAEIVARESGAIISVDTTNLDSTVKLLDYVRANQSNLERIFLVGENSAFGPVMKDLICKVLN